MLRTRVIAGRLAGVLLSLAMAVCLTVLALFNPTAPRHLPSLLSVVGMLFVHLLSGASLFTYARRYCPPRGVLLRTQLGWLSFVLFVALLCRVMILFPALPATAAPVAIAPLWVALTMSRRASLAFAPVLAFSVGSFSGFDVTVITALLASGFGAAISLRDRKHLSSLFTSGVLAGLASAVMYFAMCAATGRAMHFGPDPLRAETSVALLGCLGGAIGASVIAWLLSALASRVLGVVSRDVLLDLSDVAHPVLMKMANGAPGSWEHSRAMANLAEAASAAIGADALLTRVGAYYHDLGKTVQPKYFVENLSPGERSPHEDLDPDVSADAIMVHVVQGAKILRDAGIPEPVVEFAYTHHGSSVIEYFWHKCKQQGNPKGLTEDHFRYPGMKPRSRETAILMLVDGIEAAARTIDAPNLEKFQEMIHRVMFSKLRQGQLDDSGLTIQELQVMATSLSHTLVNAYHHRIKYPWQQGTTSAPPAVAPKADAPKTQSPADEVREKPNGH